MTDVRTVFKDQEIGEAIVRLIRGAKQRVLLVSPYVKVWRELEDALQTARQRRVYLDLLYRTDGPRNQLDPKAQYLFDSYRPIDRLHAKLYVFDDTEFLLSTMNLHQGSIKRNSEIASRIIDEGQKRVFRDYVEGLKAIAGASGSPVRSQAHYVSQPVIREVEPWYQRTAGPRGNTRRRIGFSTAQDGFCIRCGTRIPFDPQHAICTGCFRGWMRKKDYGWDKCHSCGPGAEGTTLKPLCWGCLTKSKAY